MGEPPVTVGGAQLAVASIAPPAVPATAVPMTGAPGTVADVTATERAENAPVPAALVAATAKVYAVPLVSPVTTRLVALAGAVWLRTTVVPVPLSAGGVQCTVAEAAPGSTVPIVGAAGTVRGVTAADRAEAGLLPSAVTAVTSNVYAVPLASPVTVTFRAVAAVVWVTAAVVPVPT